ncbi:DUF6731 family protein [Streptococcus dysgalactiae]|uniref:DUF6731 family protein n=1 Tax=Streptococcus dysgalactiae TaxID=1334 RepID=UPI003FD8A028
MTKYKPIRFYYHACYNGDNVVDLTEIFDGISRLYATGTPKYSFNINENIYSLERVKRPTDNDNYYHIVVEELRDFDFPSRTKIGGESLDLDLEEDEFLGEKMSALYDGDNHIFMLQVNRNSISTLKFELFLNCIIEKFGTSIDLRLPVILQNDAEAVANAFVDYKSIAIGMNQFSKITGTFDLISAFKSKIGDQDSGLFDAMIVLKAKKDKLTGNQYLPDSVVHEVLSYDREGITKLEVRGRNLDGRLETVDIIENKLIDIINFSYNVQGRTLRPNSVFEEMKIRYNKNKYKVLRNI